MQWWRQSDAGGAAVRTTHVNMVRDRRLGYELPIPFSVRAYVDDNVLTVTADAAKEAFAKAVEWHVAKGFRAVSISDGHKRFTVAEYGIARDCEHGQFGIFAKAIDLGDNALLFRAPLLHRTGSLRAGLQRNTQSD